MFFLKTVPFDIAMKIIITLVCTVKTSNFSLFFSFESENFTVAPFIDEHWYILCLDYWFCQFWDYLFRKIVGGFPYS